MSMPLAVRLMNERRALQALLHDGAMSRAALARRLEITRSTASSIVANLVADGRVKELSAPAEEDAQRTGRPGIRVALDPDHALFLGVDIGAQLIRLCVVDYTGALRHGDAQPLVGGQGPEAVADQLARMVADYRASLPRPDAVAGLNVAVPGVVDAAGCVSRAPPLGWGQVALRDELQARLPEVPVVRLVNDANAFAVAERHAGEPAPPDEALYILIDEGVGGCIFAGGRMVEGAGGFAGEIGHMPFGRPGHGTLTGLPEAFENHVARGAVLTHLARCGGTADTLEALSMLLAEEVPAARKVLETWSADFGRGLAVLATLFNPSEIVVGGAVAMLFGQTRDACRSALAAHLMPGTPVPGVRLATLGAEAPSVGAARLLHEAAFAAHA